MLLGKSSTHKIPWGQLLIEAALVVFSVLLALGVKSCHDTQIQEELANQALRNFKFEVLENKTEIEEVYDYHKSLVDSFSGENPSSRITLRSPDIQNNAWEVAQSTGAIGYIDFEVIEMASKIEELQDQYQDFLRRVHETILMLNFQSDLEAPRVSDALHTIAIDIVNYESSLLRLYDEALKRISAAGLPVSKNSTTSAQSDSVSVMGEILLKK